MGTLSDFFSGPFGVIVFVAAAMAMSALVRLLRSRRGRPARIVERPNSHYTAQAVRDGETRHRWAGIDLDGIHEANRGEVVRLLACLEAGGVDALRPIEQLFLDQLTGAPEPRLTDGTRNAEPHATQEPHYRPA
jgi:hypothetical protein